MTSLLARAFASLRVWLGLNDPAENHPYPPHGWLLLPSIDVRARALQLDRTLSPAPASTGRGYAR
jgi:hypothetical protein